MEVITQISEMQKLSKYWQRNGDTVSLIPTMGFLHNGHVALVRAGKQHATKSVVSIFVNPTQFSQGDDFEKYPCNHNRDKKLCENLDVSALFLPSSEEMYRSNFSTWVTEENLSRGLCGKFRPGHFKGVTTIVCKLFLAVFPDIAVFGQKDAQQALVIRRMIHDLNFPIKMLIIPTEREKDGLAISSRNQYLNKKERQQATAIYSGLTECKKAYESGERNAGRIKDILRESIEKSGGKIEYIVCVNSETLQSVMEICCPSLLAVAAFYGTTRLIDNYVYSK